MGEGYAAIQRGGRLPAVGGGGSLMTHSAGSVTTQRKAFKHVMASEQKTGFFTKIIFCSISFQSQCMAI